MSQEGLLLATILAASAAIVIALAILWRLVRGRRKPAESHSKRPPATLPLPSAPPPASPAELEVQELRRLRVEAAIALGSVAVAAYMREAHPRAERLLPVEPSPITRRSVAEVWRVPAAEKEAERWVLLETCSGRSRRGVLEEVDVEGGRRVVRQGSPRYLEHVIGRLDGDVEGGSAILAVRKALEEGRVAYVGLTIPGPKTRGELFDPASVAAEPFPVAFEGTAR